MRVAGDSYSSTNNLGQRKKVKVKKMMMVLLKKNKKKDQMKTLSSQMEQMMIAKIKVIHTVQIVTQRMMVLIGTKWRSKRTKKIRRQL